MIVRKIAVHFGSLAALLILPMPGPARAGQQRPPTQPISPKPIAAEPVATDLAPESIAGRQVAQEQIDTLVRKLGSADFAAREKASRELIALGIVTREALLRAADDSDAEVRRRARAILAKVYEADFEARLNAFSADYDGSRRRTLPAWDQFSSEFGASRLCRELFVEMQRAEPDLLEAMAESPKRASEVLAERTQRILGSERESLANTGTLAALLFVGSAAGVVVTEQDCLNVYPYVIQSAYHRNNRSPLWPGILKKLVSRWITKDSSPATVNQNLLFASQLDLKDEAMAIALRQLTRDDGDESQAKARQMAILVVGQFGDKSHLPLLEKMLSDTASCGIVPTEKPPHKIELQIRDVALAALLHLTDQELTEYGFMSARNYVPPVLSLGPLGFGDAESRDKALAKWAAWRAEHPDS